MEKHYRFGILKTIVVDHGSQFISSKVKELCNSWNINMNFLAPSYPQLNSQAEAKNNIIFNTLNKWLESAKGSWSEELPGEF